MKINEMRQSSDEKNQALSGQKSEIDQIKIPD